VWDDKVVGSPCIEMTEDKVRLLSLFVPVAGLKYGGILVRLTSEYGTIESIYYTNIFSTWDNDGFFQTDLSDEDLVSDGTIILQGVDDMAPYLEKMYDPKLLLSKGVRIILTDMGSLVYLDCSSFKGKTLRLSDYVRGIVFDGALVGLSTCDLILDSKLQDFDLCAFICNGQSTSGITFVLDGVSPNLRSLAYMLSDRLLQSEVREIL